MSSAIGSLVLGALELNGPAADGSYSIEVRDTSDGFDWGSGSSITQTLISFLQDGGIVNYLGNDNRTLAVPIGIKAADLNALAAAEAAVRLECVKAGRYGGWNELVWTPRDPMAAPAVFEVVLAELAPDGEASDEVYSNPFRRYVLTLTALPFAKSSTPMSTVIPPPPAGGVTITSVDDCTATTNWTGVPSVAEDVGSLVATQTLPSSGSIDGHTLVLSRSFAMPLDLSATPFLRVDADLTVLGGNFAYWTALATIPMGGGSTAHWTLPLAAQSGSVYWFALPAEVVAAGIEGLQFQFGYTTQRSGTSTATLRLNDVSATDGTIDPTATNRELFSTIPVSGSERGPATIELSSAADAGLGTTLVYTGPVVDGMAQPPLHPYLATGGTITPDSSTLSGGYCDISDAPGNFNIPAAAVPAGAYLLVARVRRTVTGGSRTLGWTVGSVMGATSVLDESQAGSVDLGDLGDAEWHMVTVALLSLPTRVTGPSGFVHIELSADAHTDLDDALLFNVETGRLTWLECGEGAAASGAVFDRLWIDAADLDNPLPRVQVGTVEDRGDAVDAGPLMTSFGAHEVAPPAVNVFTATTGADDVTVTLTHTPRWHTHPVDLGVDTGAA